MEIKITGRADLKPIEEAMKDVVDDRFAEIVRIESLMGLSELILLLFVNAKQILSPISVILATVFAKDANKSLYINGDIVDIKGFSAKEVERLLLISYEGRRNE
jgi:hypothetical protein